MAGKKQDFSDIYDAIREAEKEGRTEDVAKLASYLETESAKPSEDQTYDPRDKSSGFIPAGVGAATAAVVKPVVESGVAAMEKGRAPQGGSLSRGPVVGEVPPGHTPYNPKGRSVEGSLENWRTYNEAQLEAAKKVRQESALQKKYPGFTRAGTNPVYAPLAKNASPAERIAARMLPGGVSDVANFAKGVMDYKLPIVGSVGSLAGRALAGAGAGIQAQEAYNRGVEGDDAGKWIGYIGAAGTGASALPFPPPIRAAGAGVGISAEAINAYRDAMRKGRIKHGAPEHYENTDTMGNMYASGGPVQHFFGGGSISPLIAVSAIQPQASSDTTTNNSLVPAATAPIAVAEPAQPIAPAVEPVQAFSGQLPSAGGLTSLENPDTKTAPVALESGMVNDTPMMTATGNNQNVLTQNNIGAGSVMPTIRQYTPQRPQQTVVPRRPQHGGMPTYMQNNQAYEAQRQSRAPYTVFPPANQLLPQGKVTPRRGIPVARMAEGGSPLPEVSLDTRNIPSMTGQPGVGYMQTPQGTIARLQLEKELEQARLRAGVSGMAMALPGQHGVKMMPGQMDVGANMAMGPGRLDVSANRSINPMPGKGHMQGVRANYTIPFAEGGKVKKKK